MIYKRGFVKSLYLFLQGAFTGVCSAQHVPSYKKNIDKFKAKGIDSVICVSVNDPYVMNGWADKLGAKDAVSPHFILCNHFSCHFICSLTKYYDVNSFRDTLNW